jgi:hypothetical protein
VLQRSQPNTFPPLAWNDSWQNAWSPTPPDFDMSQFVDFPPDVVDTPHDVTYDRPTKAAACELNTPGLQSSRTSIGTGPGRAVDPSPSTSLRPSARGSALPPFICTDHDPIVTFQRSKDYERHQKTIHGDGKNLFWCPGNRCRYKTTQADSLKRHRKTKGH